MTFWLFKITKKWNKVSSSKQKLQGKWLMAGRVTDEGEKRRDLNRSRKTMKILTDGFFQWIAFDTSNFRFFGSGGGSYNTEYENNPEKGEYHRFNLSPKMKSISVSYTHLTLPTKA